MTNEEIHGELKAIHNELQEMAKAQAVQASRCIGHFERTSNVELTLFGNGRNGLKTRVDRLEIVGKTKAQLYATIVSAVAAMSALAGVIVMLVQR